MSYIHPSVVIGRNVFIGHNCSIGSPAEYPDQVDPRKEPLYTVFIGDNTIIRDNVTINAGHLGNTVIGADCYIMSHSHVGHDTVIGDNVVLHSACVIGGHSIIASCCRIGLNASLHQHTQLAFGTMVGAQSFVKGIWKDHFRILAGVPAKDIGFNERLYNKLNSVR